MLPLTHALTNMQDNKPPSEIQLQEKQGHSQT